MSQMSNSERAMLHNMHASISACFSELNYTFEFNPETIKLDLIQKTNPTCHTRHTLTKAELYNWYKVELVKYQKNGYSKLAPFKEYAEYYKMGFSTYMKLLTQTINDAEEENPEYFI